jgi:hypothetical protein
MRTIAIQVRTKTSGFARLAIELNAHKPTAKGRIIIQIRFSPVAK